MAQPWEQDSPVRQVAPRAPQPAAPPPFIAGQVSPTKQAADSRDQTRTDIAVEGAGRDARKEVRDVQSTNFNQAMGLRDDYNKLPEIKSYRVAIQQLDQALKTGQGPQSDLALTYAFAKAMDPDSVVREAEQGMVTNSQPWFQTVVENAKKQFGMDGAGNYTPEARQAIRQQIINAVASRRQIYTSKRGYYTDLANRYGFDPQEVIGPDDGAPYLDRLKAYDDRGKQNGVVGVQMSGGLPTGTEIQFGMDKPEEPFDRDKWLKETQGITSDQEEIIVAFWNKNRGNKGMTAEGVKQWYRDNALPIPSDATLNDWIGKANEGNVRFTPFDSSEAEKAYQTGLQSQLNQRGFEPTSAGAYASRALAGAELGFSDEIEGAGAALGAFLQGENAGEAYITARDRTRLAKEQMEKEQGIPGQITEFAGGLAVPVKALPRGSSIAQYAKQGAKIGGLAGFGYGEGAQGSIESAVVGAGLGGVLGAGAGKLAGKLENRATPSVASSVDTGVIEAGQRLDVPVRRPDFDPSVRGQMGALEKTEKGGPIIRGALAEDVAKMEARTAELGGAGAASDPYALGGKVQEAGKRFITESRDEASKLYLAADRAAKGQRVAPQQAIKAVAETIAELEGQGANANRALIDYLKGLGEDLSKPGGFSITEFQGLRSANRAKIKGDNALTATNAERLLGDISRAFTADATTQLPKAASARLAQADKFYAERMEFIKGTLKAMMGTKGNPLPAETAATRLTSMAQGKGNHERFTAMWGKLSTEEQADTAATIAASLGRKANGEFSLATLVKSLDPASGINPRTARLIFGDDGVKALADLRVLAKAKVAASAERNFSNTGNIVSRTAGGLKTALLGALGFSTGGLMGGVALPVAARFMSNLGDERAARLLMNPKFTKWLRQAPQTTNPAAIDRYLSRLGAIGLPANDNTAFLGALREAFRLSPERAAAQDEADSRSIPPQQ